ncbi:Dynactin subunit 4, variant 2 [Balamuthia mandrillaris]
MKPLVLSSVGSTALCGRSDSDAERARACRCAVLYACQCRRRFGIAQLFYCQQCSQVRCPFCVSEEIDSHYCPNCLDNMTSYDALLFKNRCKKCFQCPNCFSALTFAQKSAKSSSSAAAAGAEGAAVAEAARLVYFHCGFCRWSSLSTEGLQAENPSTLITNYIRMERGDALQTAMDELVKGYKAKARETRLLLRAQRFSRATAVPSSISSLFSAPSSSPSLSSSSSAKNKYDDDENEEDDDDAISSKDKNKNNEDDEFSSFLHRHYPITVQEVEEQLKEREEKLTLQGRKKEFADKRKKREEDEMKEEDEAALLKRRLAEKHTEPKSFAVYKEPRLIGVGYPQRVQLLTRHSKRCRHCDKLLIKPDLIASKTEFKRQHSALYLFFCPVLCIFFFLLFFFCIFSSSSFFPCFQFVLF